MLRKVAVCLIASVSLTLAGIAAPTASASEYIRQSSSSFTFYRGTCTGETWIGQTTSNSIQAIVTLRCSGQAGFLTGEIILRKNGSFTPTARNVRSANTARYLSASTSAYGGSPRTRWCAQGHGEAGNVAVTAGDSTVCITT
jgi:hypothetical protein